MRVLVTGGAGFIGSHLTDALLARGDEVAVVDDLSAGRAGRVHEGAVLHKLSITAAGPLEAVIRELRPELVCHLAAQIDVRTSVAAPAADAAANVVGTVNVLEAARAVGARVLFCSTGGALYGKDAPIPSLEDVLPLPESPYGVAKQCAEQYVGLYNRLHGTAHVVLRLSNVYGPRQDPGGESGVIPIFCSRILAGKNCGPTQSLHMNQHGRIRVEDGQRISRQISQVVSCCAVAIVPIDRGQSTCLSNIDDMADEDRSGKSHTWKDEQQCQSTDRQA